MTSIFKRRSVRRYTDQKVEKEKIESLLRAAMQAPSACNQQPWEFIVVEDKQTVEQLSKFSPYARMLLEAPLAIIILEKPLTLLHLHSLSRTLAPVHRIYFCRQWKKNLVQYGLVYPKAMTEKNLLWICSISRQSSDLLVLFLWVILWMQMQTVLLTDMMKKEYITEVFKINK